jgi:uncharacterized membrane protein YeaQ/YmgE (transglycosylase-associated protein family)
MESFAAVTVAVLVGWLATLIMQTEEDILLLDFIVGVFGAGLAEALAPALGVSATGEFGLSLPGTLFAWAGATVLLALFNLTRFGTLRRGAHGRGTTAPLAQTKPGL